MFKNFIKLMALGSLILSSVNIQAQIRPPDISQSTSSVWVWRGKTKFGSGTPAVTQIEGSMYVSGILESNNAVYFKGISSTGQIMWINSSGQVNVVTLGSGLSFNTGTSTLTATGTIGGSGTSGLVARWTSSSAIGTGVMQDDGTHAAIGTTPTSDMLTVLGNINATTFTGSGSGLTSIPAGNLTGSVADARLSANVALYNAATPIFTNTLTAGAFSTAGVGAFTNGVNAGATRTLRFTGDNAASGFLLAGGIISTSTVDSINILADGSSGTPWNGVRLLYFNGSQFRPLISGFNVPTGTTPILDLLPIGGTTSIGGTLGIGTQYPMRTLSFIGTAAKTLGMDRNGTNNTAGFGLTVNAGGANATGTVLTLQINGGGTGYRVGDILNLTGGSGTAKAIVTTVSSGVITALQSAAVFGGTGYSTTTGSATTLGSGTGATVDILTISSTTDKAGGNLTLQAGTGVGSGAAASIVLQTSTVGASGTTDQTQATRLTVNETNVNATVPIVTSSTITGTTVNASSVVSSGAISGTTITGSGVVTGSGLKATGLLSQTALATDGSGNLIAGSGGGGRNPGVTKVVAASNSVVTTGADFISDGTDDQEQINLALTAAGVGGTVRLLDGTYTIHNGAFATANIVPTANYQTIEGGSRDGVKIVRGGNGSTMSNGPLIWVGAFNGLTIQHLTLDGVKASFTNANNYGIYFNGVTVGLTVTDVAITNNQGDGLGGGSSFGNSRIFNNNFSGNAGVAIYPTGGADNCEIYANRIIGGTYGIRLSSPATNNYVGFNSISGHANYAIFFSGSSNNTALGNVVTGGSTGIWTQGGAGTTLAKNQIYSTGANGITVTSMTGMQILGNYISAPNGDAIYEDGAGGTAQDRAMIADNNILSPTGHGIELLQLSNSTVQNNRIHNAGGSGASNGITLSTNSDNNKVSTNLITDTAGTGYAISIASGCDTTALDANTFSGTGAIAISDASGNALWDSQWNGSNFVTMGGDSRMKRIDASTGATAVVLGDVALSGWGTGASVAIAAGSTDLAGTMTITAGTTPSANPTATLTYKDGAYKDSSGTNQSPFFMANWNTGSTGAAAQIGTSMTATTGVATYMALPVSTMVYVINWHTIGGR